MEIEILQPRLFICLLVSSSLLSGCKSEIKKEKILNQKVTAEAVQILVPGMKIVEVEKHLGRPCMFHPDIGLEGGARAIPNRKIISSYIWCFDCNYMQTISAQFEDSILIERKFNPATDVDRLNETPCLIQK